MLDEDRRTLVYVTSDCEPQPVLVFACNAANMCVRARLCVGFVVVLPDGDAFHVVSWLNGGRWAT